jgi:hypothetical protein
MQGILADGKNNFALKQMLASVAFVQSTLQTIPSFFDLSDTTELRSDLHDNLKVTDLTASLQYIRTNEKRIRKGLDIAKDTKLHEVAEKYLTQSTSDNAEEKRIAIEKANQLIKELRQRVNTKLGIEVAKLIVRVAGIAATSIVAFTAPNPVACSLGIAVGGASVGLWVVERLLLNKNAFKEPTGDWYDSLSRSVCRAVYTVTDALDEGTEQVAQVVRGKFKNFFPSGLRLPVAVTVK